MPRPLLVEINNFAAVARLFFNKNIEMKKYAKKPLTNEYLCVIICNVNKKILFHSRRNL